MFENSADLLNLTKAFCLFWLTIFVCWFFYYGIMILKSFYQITEKVTSTLQAVETFFTQAKDKILNVGQSLTAVLDISKQLINYFGTKQAAKTVKKTKNKSQI